MANAMPPGKIALCFLISYTHILNKEHLWRKWIEPNKDIINVYFHYKNLREISSPWILENCIPHNFIIETSYLHVTHAYMSIMSYAKKKDERNQWFCMLTDSCAPIISPFQFRQLFLENYNFTIMNWKRAWWNIDFHTRANLRKLRSEYWLANDPWFVLKRADVDLCLQYVKAHRPTYELICAGGLANESIFAIILSFYNKLNECKREITHITDWSRRSSPTSPHTFTDGGAQDVAVIKKLLKGNKYAMFMRKVGLQFPDAIVLEHMSPTNNHLL